MFSYIFSDYKLFKKTFIVLLIVLSTLNSSQGLSQVRKVYNNIETKNVLYYKVEEIVNMVFGGTTTRYTVSDLSLISKIELGPENIRIITPVYKNERSKKNYYVETKNFDTKTEKSREPTSLLEIAIESGAIEISQNAEIEQSKLALVIGKITKTEFTPVMESEPKGEKQDYILVNVVDVYERVLDKGYKSVFMFQKVADQYYFKNQMEKAVKWYEELFALTNDLDPMYYYRFGNALLKTGNTDRGNAIIEKFNELVE